MTENLVQLSTYLKEGTRTTHTEAESNDFQRQLASAELSLGTYKQYLGQLYLVHSLLEQELADNNKLSEITKPSQFQAPYLKRDLESLNVNVHEIQPFKSTSDIMFRIQQNSRSQPQALVGYHYVLLGSKHGGKYIAVSLRKKFNFDEAGCLYFDPYGTTFQSHWAEFKEGMDRLTDSQVVADAVLAAAREMFLYFAALGSELCSTEHNGSNN